MFDGIKAQGALVRGLEYSDRSAVYPKKVAMSPIKRAVDFTLALGALLFLAPALLAIAVLIKLDSKGSVFFRQRRAGLNNEVFQIYKFRSMTVSEDGDKVTQARANDHRVTRVGKILRRTSLDEIPQLINILKGDMSFVGPRPHALAHDKEFTNLLPVYPARFAAKPGLTGLAQVRGFRGEIIAFDDLEKRISADIEYIDKWSIGMDLAIILGTVPVLFGHKNAY